MSLISGSYSLWPAGGGAEELRAGIVEKEAFADTGRCRREDPAGEMVNEREPRPK